MSLRSRSALALPRSIGTGIRRSRRASMPRRCYKPAVGAKPTGLKIQHVKLLFPVSYKNISLYATRLYICHI